MKIVLFMLRGCSAGWLGTYGNEWVGTPHCDRLAHEGIVWDRYFADLVDPFQQRQRLVPILQTLRANRVPTVLVRAHADIHNFPAPFYEAWGQVFDARPLVGRSPLRAFLDHWPQLLEQFNEQEHALLCVEIGRLLPPWDVPVDVFTAYLDLEETTSEPSAEKERVDIEEGVTLIADSKESIEEENDISPCTDPPIGPFDVEDEAAWQWLQTSYAAVITTLDAELGEAWGVLREHGWDQKAVWILTSDLGFPLGEHGRVGWDRPWLHEETVHLPLVIRLPEAQSGGRRLQAWTQPLDLWTAIAQWLGCPLPFHHSGRSLLPLLQDNNPDQLRDEAFSYWEINGMTEASLRTEEWTFLLPLQVPEGEDRQPQLYARPEDRWEVNDLRLRLSEEAEVCEQRLRELLKRFGPKVD